MMRADPFFQERGVSFHYPVSHLVSPTVFVTKKMMLGSVLHIEGITHDTEEDAVLNQFKKNWHQALLGLGEDFSVMVTLHRRKQSVTLDGSFESKFLEELDQEYRVSLENEPLYVNDIYLTVLTKGIVFSPSVNPLKKLIGLNSGSFKKSSEVLYREKLQSLNSAVSQLHSTLSDFKPRLLGLRDSESGFSELMQFLGLFINAGDSKKYVLSDERDCEERIGEFIAEKRISFGECIEFSDHNDYDKKYAAMISVKKYACETNSRIFDRFLRINCEYISTNSFYVEAKDVSQRLIAQQSRKMKNVDDPAVSQIGELNLAMDNLASDRMEMGYHHNTIMVIEDSVENLNSAVSKLIKAYSDIGFAAIRETIGQEPTFWSQIPGNFKMIARSALLSSENFVDFCPLYNYRKGYRDANHLGSAVTILRTLSNTPYFFNFHARGSLNNPSKGHTIIVGGNGSGKTVMMAFFDAQLSRYHGRTFIFDRDRGLEIYVRAAGGFYAVLTPANKNNLSFNPFCLPDTEVNRKFCRAWMAQLIKEEGEEVIPADLSRLVAECVDYAYEALPINVRTLSNAVKILPVNFSRWSQLRRWLRSDGVEPEGEYAYLFDNVRDDVQIQRKVGFDMTHFLDHEPKNVLVALMMYLFHRLEQSLDGNLVTVMLDEGWQYLDDIYWIRKLKRWLPTLRKLNCHLVLATQSPSSIVDSPIRNMMLDNAATNIYFQNPQARYEHYCDGLNLSESEYHFLKESSPALRQFIVKQEHESTVCTLDLSALNKYLPVFSANKKSLLILDSLMKKQGESPSQWLNKFMERCG